MPSEPTRFSIEIDHFLFDARKMCVAANELGHCPLKPDLRVVALLVSVAGASDLSAESRIPRPTGQACRAANRAPLSAAPAA